MNGNRQQRYALTPSERRVLSLAADGYRPCDMANRMATSVCRVNDHIYQVLVKTGVKSMDEAVMLHYRRAPSRAASS